MPRLIRVLTEADVAAARIRPITDLTPYLEIIDAITRQGGVGGEISLAPNESQRTEKRRLSLAAKQRNLRLTWRKARPGELRFVISVPGAPTPGGRRRRESS